MLDFLHNSIFSIIPKSVGQSTSFLYWVSLFAYFCNGGKKICAHSSANSIFLENLDFKVRQEFLPWKPWFQGFSALKTLISRIFCLENLYFKEGWLERMQITYTCNNQESKSNPRSDDGFSNAYNLFNIHTQYSYVNKIRILRKKIKYTMPW